MNAATICAYVRDILDKYHERDPFRLCNDMDILLNRAPMGVDIYASKGFYIRQFGINVITVNSDQPEYIQKIVCAHEIGHSVLHSDIVEACCFENLNLTQKTEREANLFAAEYLLSDEIVLSHIEESESVYTLAQKLEVPTEILLYKLQTMESKGIKYWSPLK